MSAESRARRERPHLMNVRDLVKASGENPAWTTSYALFAVAFAILDHSDGVREVATEIRKNRQENER